MKKVAVSIHAIDDFDPNIIRNLKGLDFIHVDVMDGKFVNNTNNNLDVFRLLKDKYDIPIIAHLMVNNPKVYIDKIIEFIDYFIFHFESEGDKEDLIKRVHNYNKSVGIAINPDTEVLKIIPFLNSIDIILVMSVNPGWSGQKFIPKMIDKVNNLAKYKKKYNFEIDIDGGVNLVHAKVLINADILSSASAILKSVDPNFVIQQLKKSDEKE